MNSLFLTEADSGLYFVFRLKTAVRNTIMVQKRQTFSKGHRPLKPRTGDLERPHSPAQKFCFARYTLPGAPILFCHFISEAQLSYILSNQGIEYSIVSNMKIIITT